MNLAPIYISIAQPKPDLQGSSSGLSRAQSKVYAPFWLFLTKSLDSPGTLFVLQKLAERTGNPEALASAPPQIRILRGADTLLNAASEELSYIGVIRGRLSLSPDEQEFFAERDSPDGQNLFQIKLELTAQLNVLGEDKMHYVTNQVEKSTKPKKVERINRGLTANQTIPPPSLVETSLRTGWIAKYPVVYRVVVSGSKDA
ncbi:hypothetical protein BDV93DRAFT_573732 [Ceratobasidium sp. AG-I]|nr:hypothetical protein BDV93DRAFT_573732 [Ceratobasidium sp. AG-I]